MIPELRRPVSLFTESPRASLEISPTTESDLTNRFYRSRLGFLSNSLNLMSDAGLIVDRNYILQKANEKDINWLISRAYRNEHIRSSLLSEVDYVAYQESKKRALDILDANESNQSPESLEDVSPDVLIVGSGVGGLFAVQLRKAYPNLNILLVDNSSILGGQFRNNSFPYKLNSPTIGDKSGLPGELDGPNNLGPYATFQIADLSDDLYPNSKIAGENLALNSYFNAPALLNSYVTSVEITEDKRKPYKVKIFNAEIEKELSIFPTKLILFVPGLGKPKWGFNIDSPQTSEAISILNNKQIFTSVSFQNFLVDMARQDPGSIRKLLHEGLAFGGGRDSSSTTIEFIVDQLHSQGYSDTEINKMDPIHILGAHFSNGDEFIEVTANNRYNHLAKYVGEGKLIHPLQNKVLGLRLIQESVDDIRVGVSLQDADEIVVKMFCNATGYDDKDFKDLIYKIKGTNPYPITGKDSLNDVQIGLQIDNEKIFVGGIAGSAPKREYLNSKALRGFNRAFRRYIPWVIQLGDILIQEIANSQPIPTRRLINAS